MSYENRIRTLEESYRLIDNQLFQLEKNGNPTAEALKKLQEKKTQFLDEIRNLRRLEWEDRERVDLDDDR